jgi:hypothetical protein
MAQVASVISFHREALRIIDLWRKPSIAGFPTSQVLGRRRESW